MRQKKNYIKQLVVSLIVLLFLTIFFLPYARSDQVDNLPVVVQELVKPPFVPKHSIAAKGGPKVIKVRMTVTEKVLTIDKEGTKFRVFAFNDSVPGPIIVAHVGDYIELTLTSPKENNFEHNIDFHASTGALGGGGLTHILPGEAVILR